jgi:inward rectifier potassium channel
MPHKNKDKSLRLMDKQRLKTNSKYVRPIRLLRRDGELNLQKDSLNSFRIFNLLIRMSWQRLFFYALVGYVIMNLLFTVLYCVTGGSDCLAGMDSQSKHRFFNIFFFSTQTFTTVGYGHIYPTCFWTNMIVAFESFVGFLFFSVVTGLFYTKFTQPRVEVALSKVAVFDNFMDGYALKFMLANEYENKLVDVEVTLDLIKLEIVDGRYKKRFYKLPLMRHRIPFLSVPWTVLHPIDPKSPLWGLTHDEFIASSMEFFIQVKVFDEAHRQVLFKEYSYFGIEEVLWGAKFVNIQRYTETGALKIGMGRFGKTTLVKDFPKQIPPLTGE